MVIGGLRDLRVDAEQRVQRRHRVLQDHRDLGAADAPHLARRVMRDVLAGKLDPAADDLRRRRPSASIDPQAGSGGGTPTPRNDSEASAMMTTPIVREASTIVELSTLGRMWRKMTRAELAPAISDNLMKSRSLRLRTSPRITRA